MSDAACFIFGAGPFYGLVETPKPGDRILAADGGYRHCLAVGLQPDLLLGDFDSLDDLLPELESKKFPVEKDDTDTMLAIKLGLDLGHQIFHLYGGTGGRMDHTLANLQCLLFLAEHGASGYLYDRASVVTAVKNGALTFPAGCRGNLSVFTISGPARGITLRGLKYGLEDGVLTPDLPLGVSNSFTGTAAEISVCDGTLLVWYDLQAE